MSSTGGTDQTGGSSGISDTTFSDATLGDQMMGGSGSFTDPTAASAASGPSEFSQFSDLANLFSGGGTTGTSSVGAQSAAMTPPSAVAITGGDPTGAAGGTQSATAPGSTPAANSNQPQQNQQQQSEHAPPQAVDQLRTLLKALSGKPTGPTAQVPQAQPPTPFALPTLAAGQTGPQSPLQPFMPLAKADLNQEMGASPAAASLEQGGTPPPAGTEPGGSRDIPVDTSVSRDAQGNPVTAAGTPAADTPTPPPRPSDAAPSTTGGQPTPQTDDQGRQITVRKAGNGAAPPTQTADLPTRVPHPDSAVLPTHKPGAAPAPTPATQYPATTQIQRDLAGISTGQPTALADIARAAMTLAPLILPLLMGGGGGRRGHFHGGRFTHGVGPFRGFGGGMRAMGGRHPPMRGPWPYHHPVHGWDMHHMHPGGGWRPLSPMDAQSMGLLGGGQDGQQQQDPNALDPNRPPKETGADPGPASDTPSGAIPGVSGKQVDDYTREAAKKYGINPDVASKVLAIESSYGQARRPGDNGTSFGPFQLHFAPDGHAMGDEFRRDTRLDPRDPSTWKQQVDYAMMRAATDGWKPWTTTMNKLGMSQWSGITTNPRFARQPVTNQQPSNVVRAASIPPTLPITSQPMVGG